MHPFPHLATPAIANLLDTEFREVSPKVSVILPAYNEREGVIALIHAIRLELKGVDCEVILVDDNSPDGTADAVRDLFAGDETVRVVVRTENKGLAPSIERGILESKGDYLVVMDSDFNHQPGYLPFMIHALKHYQFVSGSRYVYGGLMNSRSRHFMSWIFNIFVRVVTGGLITDNLYGFFSCRRELIMRYETYFPFVFRGFGEYYIRLLHLLQKDGIRILQFPAINGERRAGKGNAAFFRVFVIYFIATLSCRWKLRKI